MTVLFVSSFLSRVSGTKGVSETISTLLNKSTDIKVLLVSRKRNPLLRALDIMVKVAFSRFDVLHVDTFSGNAFYFAAAAVFIGRLRRKRLVMNLRGGRLAEYTKDRPKFVLNVLRMADRVVTPATFLKSFYEAKGLRVQYVPNPIDLTKFPFKRKELNLNQVRILWVRAFADIYNPEMAVSVLNKVLNNLPSAKLSMIGPDKGELQRVRELVDRLALGNHVEILGPVHNDQLHQYYQSHDVYINTTSFESFGVSVMEAASCGLPIVSTRVGELPFLWKDGEEMLMVEDGDESAMATEVVRVLTNSGLAALLSTNARRRSEEFSWTRIRPIWLELLKIS